MIKTICAQALLALALIAAANLWGLETGSFEWIKWASMVAAAGASLLWFASRDEFPEFDALDHSITTILIWTAITLLWAPDQQWGWLMWTRLAVASLVFHVARRVPIGWLPYAAAAAIFGICGQLIWRDHPYFGGSGNENDVAQLLAVLTAMALGVGGKLTSPKRIPGDLAAAAAIIYLVFFSHSRMGYIGLAPLALIALARCGWRYVVAVLAPIAAGLAVAVWLYPDVLLRSALPRGQIWLDTLAMFTDSPFHGVGLGGFEWWWHEYQSYHLEPPWGGWWPHQGFMDVPRMRPGAVHSDWLQALVEFGLIGAIPCAAAVVLAIVKSGRVVAYQGALFGVLALAAIDFPLQKPAVLFAAAVAAAAATHRGSPACNRTRGWAKI